MENIVKIHNLEFAYGDNKVLDKISFEIKKGECLGILGSNGSGKTTLIDCILGENRYIKGSIEILGENYNGNNNIIKKYISVVPDNEMLIEYLTMNEYLNFIGNVYGMKSFDIDNSIEKWTKRFKIENFKNKILKNFSHGMKKKTQIIAAIMNKPKLLIIDEPTNGLDIETIYELKDIIEELKNEGVAILISTHILEFAEKVCSNVIILNNNKTSKKLDVKSLKVGLEAIFLNYIRGNIDEITFKELL